MAKNAVAFVTYNTVGDTLSSGWHDSNGRRALVLQNTKGESWGAGEAPGKRDSSVPLEQLGENRRGQIGNLWGELQRVLTELDHVVVYVGARGSERAIELAAQLPPSKVTFVSCDCGLLAKELMIQVAGMDKAGRVLCECGGHRTMETLFRRFMVTGELLTSESA